jgi:hypothetical protein
LRGGFRQLRHQRLGEESRSTYLVAVDASQLPNPPFQSGDLKQAPSIDLLALILPIVRHLPHAVVAHLTI